MALKTVTGLTTGAAATICTPSIHDLWVCIQNVSNGNQVNLGPDGGTAYTDPYTNKVNVDPTTTATGLGEWLPAGQTVKYTLVPGKCVPIRAIMATGTTTLSISTNSQGTSFPTN